jgi:hypothetical protein
LRKRADITRFGLVWTPGHGGVGGSSATLDEELATAGIEMIVPHRGNRKKLQHKTDARCYETADVTKRSDCSPGCETSVVWLLDMNTI